MITDKTAETVRSLRILIGDDVRPVQELLRAPPKQRKYWSYEKQRYFYGPVPRKSHNRNGSACNGKDVSCLPGLNGKCVACFDDD